MDKEITIEEYNSNWSKQFVEEKVKLEEILADNVISIEHIGSTSIVGLAAKPIIDIAIGVNDLDVVDKFIDPLKQIEYEFVYHREFPERRFFRKGQWRAGTHHLHIYQFGGEEWNNQILFREYLINNPVVLMEYHQLKLDLARNYRFDRVAYTENKAPFIQKVLLEAKEE
ncbi:GrpB family protein [Metabacillus litoralis]|uniref:GrpB family protein n=1 Tax=Metabacillus litoralis TaxID=152268 RepID=A0A5C6W5S8_9BACI|nr:GrpB family protein [Metabacillus litoralis]TXC92764.1 GrpB family protein [Metabacillus litoralis]